MTNNINDMSHDAVVASDIPRGTCIFFYITLRESVPPLFRRLTISWVDQSVGLSIPRWVSLSIGQSLGGSMCRSSTYELNFRKWEKVHEQNSIVNMKP